MKKKLSFAFIIIIISIISLTGCTQIEDEISKEEAQELVIKQHNRNYGKVEIISIETKTDRYIIKWENDENSQKGVDEVHKNGDLNRITIETEIEEIKN